MKTYRIHVAEKAGGEVVSDPLDIRSLTQEQTEAFLDDIVKMAEGGYLTMHVQGVRKAFLHSSIKDIYWTGS